MTPLADSASSAARSEFIVDERHLLLEKTWRAPRALGGGDRGGPRRGAADRALARPPPPRLVRRDQRREHRARAAQPRPDRDRDHVPRRRLHKRDGGARRARGAADPHERLRRRRRGRGRGGRGREGHGDDAVAGAAPDRAAARAAADLRRASGRRRSSSSRQPRSPRSPAAAGSATSSSTRPATGSRAWSARRSASRSWRSLPTACSGSCNGCSRRRDCGHVRNVRTGCPDGRRTSIGSGTGPDRHPNLPKGGSVIRKHNRRAAKAAFTIALGVAIILGGAAAAPAAHSKAAATPIIIGTKDFPEQYLLGQLYKQALEAKGFKVQYKENIASTELIDTALRSGRSRCTRSTSASRCRSRSSARRCRRPLRAPTPWRSGSTRGVGRRSSGRRRSRTST